MNDITYCTNTNCSIGSCNRHAFWADITKPNSFADFTDCPYWGLRKEAQWICRIYGKLCEYATENGYCALTACVKENR